MQQMMGILIRARKQIMMCIRIDSGRRLYLSCAKICSGKDDWTFEALESHYNALVRYLNLQDMGRVLGYGCGTPAMTGKSVYPKQAYQLGNNIK